ncbi:murein L,D-transpeptidase [Legionella beliardensis]|uniref:Murein L,D-transpeptidase n=1 Tax=Legionella beliardensis TaxID=91822 RepID=A0A378I1M4_9GAMM|nr:L,D-transpeptidase family protein [Legionella beliardensis]STX28526.1 murein L,D-transpeptidase [Legionella beliardensis]
MHLIHFNKKIMISFLIIFGIIITVYQSFKPVEINSFVDEDKKLKQFIAVYQKAAQKPWEKLKPKQLLQVGVTDKSVILLRERLQFTGDLANSIDVNNSTFDSQLQEAVSLFQKRHGLVSSGKVDKQTLAALNISPQTRLKQLQANISRWSEFTKKQSTHYLWVNVPAFQAQLIEQNRVTLKEPIIVGKPSNPTPAMFTEITDVMLNPYWIVPPTLAKKNVIPKLLQDTDYLKKQNIRVFDASNGKELSVNELDNSQLDKDATNYFFRQEPGPCNPLGQVKYTITNSESIYLHDTNARDLFKKENRALSSGCIRLQNPFNLFSKIMANDKSINKTKSDIKKILESGEPFNIKLHEPLPVFITYITAWVDEQGRLNFRDDIYKQDIG